MQETRVQRALGAVAGSVRRGTPTSKAAKVSQARGPTAEVTWKKACSGTGSSCSAECAVTCSLFPSSRALFYVMPFIYRSWA